MTAVSEKKAERVLVLDLRGRCDFTDYFVICHGTSTRQVQAIAESVEQVLGRDHDLSPKHVEGRTAGEWILLDYIDFVVHVFLDERRAYYGLERLWGDAPVVELAAGRAATPSAGARTARRRPTASG